MVKEEDRAAIAAVAVAAGAVDRATRVVKIARVPRTRADRTDRAHVPSRRPSRRRLRTTTATRMVARVRVSAAGESAEPALKDDT